MRIAGGVGLAVTAAVLSGAAAAVVTHRSALPDTLTVRATHTTTWSRRSGVLASRTDTLTTFVIPIPIDTVITPAPPPVHDTVLRTVMVHDTVPRVCPVCPVAPPPAPAPAPAPPPSPAPSPAPPPPPAAGAAAYLNPARLGAALLVGQTWQSIVTAGTTDHGWANLMAAVPMSRGSSAFPTAASWLGVYPDPTFGQAVRITNDAGQNGQTAEAHFSFPATATVWARWTLKLSPGFTAVTTTPSESGTYKFGFLFPVGNRVRQEIELFSSGQLFSGCPTYGTGSVRTAMISTNAATPAPAPAGAFAGLYAGTKPTLGGPYAAGSMLTTGDWYALVMNQTSVSPTEYLCRFFLQRLTVAGVWQPWPYPAWSGIRSTGVAAGLMHEYWVTGNKSGAATLTQHLWLGPVEVSSAQDPYGFDRYGK